MSVITALLASLVLSFTLVPVLFRFLMRGAGHSGEHAAPNTNPFVRIHQRFERGFGVLRENYRNTLSWCLAFPRYAGAAFLGLMLISLLLFRCSAGISFRRSTPARCVCMCGPAGDAPGDHPSRTSPPLRAPSGSWWKSQQINVILDNIGLPYSGINLSLSDSATVGPMDGEILVSLGAQHTPTADLTAMLRRELPRRFAQLQFFFQPADIVDQVLNFGEPAPIDIQGRQALTRAPRMPRR